MNRLNLIALFIFYWSSVSLQAQNLVINGDFESNTGCQTLFGNISSAPPWDKIGNAKYYHTCSQQPNQSVPSNLSYSYQWPHSGNAYVGVNTYLFNARDYIWQKMSDTLEADKEYCVEFYINLVNCSRSGIDAIGAYFSDTVVWCPTFSCVLPHSPQVSSVLGVPIMDTLNWTKVSGRFVAAGGECYISIGNFLTDSQSTSQINDSSFNYSTVYFIDDVSVALCDSTNGLTKLEKMQTVSLFPNPSLGTVYIKGISETPQLVKILNMDGRIVYEEFLNRTDASFTINHLPNGVYSCQIHTKSGNTINTKLILIHD